MKSLAVVRNGDGSASYVTEQGDQLDHLCWRHYGHEWDTPEAVLAANPGLAAHGPLFARGVTIHFPAIEKRAAPLKTRRRLFD